MRAALAVVAGYAVWTALWLGGGVAVAAAFPEELEAFSRGEPLTAVGPLAASLALSVVCSLAAGAATARLVRGPANKPVLVMALLLFLTGVGVQLSVWSTMPATYHVAFLGLLVPMCILGARKQLD